MDILQKENEYWYGGCVKYGMSMPFSADENKTVDLTSNPTPNQDMPLWISTKGRSIWSKEGFILKSGHGKITVPDDVILEEHGKNLKDAYLGAMNKHFPFRNTMPAKKLFETVIYNTWIELTFYQSQEAVMKYADSILESGLPAGVLMIDDGWSEYYGQWSFHSGKFPDSKSMIDKLHGMGFKVMVWVCPYIAPDSVRFREARDLDILIKDTNGKPFITEWWNGFSAVLDFSNPKTEDWMRLQLDALCDLGVDGFKFDGGDSIYYREDNQTYGDVSPDEQSRLWAQFGERYPYNEYRVTFKAGGYALLQRLCDKDHSWGNTGIASLIPDTLLQGITGHPYGCPDMIGGGEYRNFQEISKGNLDEELFIRHCEIACLMPTIQFSAAPYRILSNENFSAIKKSIKFREKYLPYIMEQLENTLRTGEPIVRYMTYEFPEEPVEKIIDQFILGKKYLVAPVIEKGKTGRNVYLPKGIWIKDGIKIESKGEVKYFNSALGIPLLFERN